VVMLLEPLAKLFRADKEANVVCGHGGLLRDGQLVPFEYRRALLEECAGSLSCVPRSTARDVALRLAVEHSGEPQVECVIEVRLDSSQCEWCESRDSLRP